MFSRIIANLEEIGTPNVKKLGCLLWMWYLGHSGNNTGIVFKAMRFKRNAIPEREIAILKIDKCEFSLTHNRIAELAKITASNLWKWRNLYSGFPRGVQVGHAVYYRPHDVKAWLAQHRRIDISQALERLERDLRAAPGDLQIRGLVSDSGHKNAHASGKKERVGNVQQTLARVSDVDP